MNNWPPLIALVLIWSPQLGTITHPVHHSSLSQKFAPEPDMPAEMRQIMLDTALKDAERTRKLIQDFLTLSRVRKWSG
jgi:signal transduction histidine kinase